MQFFRRISENEVVEISLLNKLFLCVESSEKSSLKELENLLQTVTEYPVYAKYIFSKKNEQGFSLLHKAVIGNDPLKTKILLKSMANVRSIADNGYNALDLAAKHGSINALKVLLEHIKDAPDFLFLVSHSAEIAINNNKLKAAEMLLKAGADINKFNIMTLQDAFESVKDIDTIKLVNRRLLFLLQNNYKFCKNFSWNSNDIKGELPFNMRQIAFEFLSRGSREFFSDTYNISYGKKEYDIALRIRREIHNTVKNVMNTARSIMIIPNNILPIEIKNYILTYMLNGIIHQQHHKLLTLFPQYIRAYIKHADNIGELKSLIEEELRQFENDIITKPPVNIYPTEVTYFEKIKKFFKAEKISKYQKITDLNIKEIGEMILYSAKQRKYSARIFIERVEKEVKINTKES